MNSSSFSSLGGKLLFYHGVSDPWSSALDTLEYYQKMAAANGGAQKAAEWSRLYLVPGMGPCCHPRPFRHADGGRGLGGKGRRARFRAGYRESFPGRSRPLCAYRKYARYKGQGYPNGLNFECRQ